MPKLITTARGVYEAEKFQISVYEDVEKNFDKLSIAKMLAIDVSIHARASRRARRHPCKSHQRIRIFRLLREPVQRQPGKQALNLMGEKNHRRDNHLDGARTLRLTSGTPGSRASS